MIRGWKAFYLYLPGTILILLGILVVFFPMLLVALISASLILLGFMAILVAHSLKELRHRGEWTVAWEPVEPFFGKWFDRVLLYRQW
jgi:hypothetical protein